MLTEFKILSEESLENLRYIAKQEGYSVLFNFHKLTQDYELRYISSPYRFNSEIELLIPDSTSWERNFDRENSFLVFEALPELLPVHAADERLWASLAFGPYLDYSKIRWGVDSVKSKDLSTLILNHWFCPTSRSRWRDHSISRLWWVGFLANSTPELTTSQVLDVLYLNSELINSFLGHPRTTSSSRVSGLILGILHKNYIGDLKIKFNRYQFRQFMHLVDLRAGKLMFDAMSDGALNELFLSCFNESQSFID